MAKKTRFRLVSLMLAKLNMNEEGRVTNFLNKVVTHCKEQIENHEHEMQREKLVFNRAIKTLDSKLADAKVDLESTFAYVDISRISSNTGQDDYVKDYLEAVHIARQKVKAIEEEIALTKASHNQAKENHEKAITLANDTIKTITLEEEIGEEEN